METPLADAAKILPEAERVPGLEAEVAALRAETTALKAQVERYEKLTALDAAIIEKEQALRGLAEQERDAYKQKAERLAKDAGAGAFWAKVWARAGQGAILGALVPGAVITPPLGALGGAVVGGIVGAIEGTVAAP